MNVHQPDPNLRFEAAAQAGPAKPTGGPQGPSAGAEAVKTGPAGAPTTLTLSDQAVHGLREASLPRSMTGTYSTKEQGDFTCSQTPAGKTFQTSADFKAGIKNGLFIPSDGSPAKFNGKPINESNPVPKEYADAIANMNEPARGDVNKKTPLAGNETNAMKGLNILKELVSFESGLKNAAPNSSNIQSAKLLSINGQEFVLSQHNDGTTKFQNKKDYDSNSENGVVIKDRQAQPMTNSYKEVLRELGVNFTTKSIVYADKDEATSSKKVEKQKTPAYNKGSNSKSSLNAFVSSVKSVFRGWIK